VPSDFRVDEGDVWNVFSLRAARPFAGGFPCAVFTQAYDQWYGVRPPINPIVEALSLRKPATVGAVTKWSPFGRLVDQVIDSFL